MKKTLLIGLLILVGLYSFAQKNVASTQIKDLSGKSISVVNLLKHDGPVVIALWATWCKPCVSELTAINDLIDDWVEETGVKFIAISIDDARSNRRVKSFVRGRDWFFDVYTDENQDFKRAMGVNLIPHTFLINNGKVVWEHSSYAAGDEEILYEKIKAIKDGKKVN